jgi:nicotinate-nucleotide pyrophosphorylase (carboxylating)
MSKLEDLALALAESKNTELLLKLALAEDIGSGDVTTQATVPAGKRATAKIVARQDGVVCGFPILNRVIQLAGADLEMTVHTFEGATVQNGVTMATITGAADAILTLERTLLNFLQRLSGIATVTQVYVRAANSDSTQLLETRKTIPGWRGLDKYAVLAGGGSNHRLGLFDQILAKENHFAVIDAAGFAEKLERLKKQAPDGVKIQVEVENLEEFRAALVAGIELILLDNMSPELMAEAVAERNEANSTALLEASGGINLDTIAKVAKSGVDRISVGALTHSVPAFDLSLLVEHEEG